MKSNNPIDQNEVHEMVRETYGNVAAGRQNGCCGADGPTPTPAAALGYRPEELAGLPEGADPGLGCGNPHASLKPGVKPAGSCCGPECCQ
jgi:hypothetical protein